MSPDDTPDLGRDRIKGIEKQVDQHARHGDVDPDRPSDPGDPLVPNTIVPQPQHDQRDRKDGHRRRKQNVRCVSKLVTTRQSRPQAYLIHFRQTLSRFAVANGRGEFRPASGANEVLVRIVTWLPKCCELSANECVSDKTKLGFVNVLMAKS